MCLAIPGKVKSITPFQEGVMRMGKVEMGGISKEINLQLVPEAKVEDYVLVHVGVAISIVDEEEAQRSLDFLKQMDELDELYNSPNGEALSGEDIAAQGSAIISKMIP
ncbi:HypC/HybG/HupF family hydrogenase formation chaperone [Persicitalea sp.]|uniref:HypC/HybG/HupF family hydrogenase formation chaperone n=1 Tax=Persicitalea sp. TaxID=3100273 RepID=UPI00359491BD